MYDSIKEKVCRGRVITFLLVENTTLMSIAVRHQIIQTSLRKRHICRQFVYIMQ